MAHSPLSRLTVVPRAALALLQSPVRSRRLIRSDKRTFEVLSGIHTRSAAAEVSGRRAINNVIYSSVDGALDSSAKESSPYASEVRTSDAYGHPGRHKRHKLPAHAV